MTSLIDLWKDNRTQLGRVKTAGAGEILPTWHVGQAQPHANDIALYATDGYSQNSLMYSCIKEKATSFAPLKPQIERIDGGIVKRHRVLSLMEQPNYYQDGAEFTETMATQYEVAGNVYIEKVRQSSNLALRRERVGWPVQELSLIRPDYITIAPGSRREEDVFVVTVGGTERRRIARADMIHIHEPNLINDYYGLSKIALLVREASIDLSMNDMNLAFFRNAGVPFGLLYVKGRQTEDQSRETKSRFAQAFNGFKKFWSLLILNMDEAKYEQLALAQSDMEMKLTRDQVESRICSVFGVPPVIVGAVVGQGDGSSFTYEASEHAFWAETMVPFCMRFARAFTMHLLSEFALVADSGAKLTYDFTAVRALQEDRSRKLREVTRLINAGWVINDALVSCGLPAIEGGDIRVLNGNQLLLDREHNILFTAPQAAGNNAPNADNPLEGAARLGGIMDEIEEILETKGR
jgi:HK97 family phage portal protein